MYLISGRHLCLQFRHTVFYLTAQFQLICRFLSRNIKIDGIQSVDAVIALWLFFHMLYFYQLIQCDHRSISCLQFDGIGLKLRFLACSSAHHPNPVLIIRSLLYRTNTQKFFLVMAVDGNLHVSQCYSQARQLFTVIFQLPLHRSSPIQFYFIYTRQLSQHRFYVLFGIVLNQDRVRGRIESICHKWPRCFIIRTAGTNLRIADSVRQLRPRLADNG